MKRGCGVLLLVLALLAPASAAFATTRPPKVALLYGDSLMFESGAAIAAKTATSWSLVNRSYPGTAPCDWLPALPGDLATYRPVTIAIETAGNSIGSCMDDPTTGNPWPTGSAGYDARYEADLNAIAATARAAGVKVVFFYAPPFSDPVRDAARVQIDADMLQIAHTYPGVSVANGLFSQLSTRRKYAAYKPCLSGETVAMGCTDGMIAIRTLPPNLDAGLHLCPDGLPGSPFTCPIYSSGEVRFAKAMVASTEHPPAPITDQ